MRKLTDCGEAKDPFFVVVGGMVVGAILLRHAPQSTLIDNHIIQTQKTSLLLVFLTYPTNTDFPATK